MKVLTHISPIIDSKQKYPKQKFTFSIYEGYTAVFKKPYLSLPEIVSTVVTEVMAKSFCTEASNDKT